MGMTNKFYRESILTSMSGKYFVEFIRRVIRDEVKQSIKEELNRPKIKSNNNG